MIVRSLAALAIVFLSDSAISKPLIPCRNWDWDRPSTYPVFLKNGDPADVSYSKMASLNMESKLNAWEYKIRECKNRSTSDWKEQCSAGVKFYSETIANGIISGLVTFLPCKYISYFNEKIQKELLANPKKYASKYFQNQ